MVNLIDFIIKGLEILKKVTSIFLDNGLNPLSKVHVAGSLSNKAQVKSGVPQRPILGPIFLILYIQDFSSNLNIDNLVQHANDRRVTFLTESL